MSNNIALCLSGHMRTYLYCFKNIYEKLLNNNNCDIFIHTWEDEKTNWQEVINIYQPKSIYIENLKQFPDKYPNDYETPRGKINNTHMISMYYKIYQCNNLKKDYELFTGKIYDWVIRLRPDVVLSKPLYLNNLNSNNLYVPFMGPINTWIDDKFALSSSKNMDLYSNVYLHIDEFYSEPKLLHPETLLRICCVDKYKLNISDLSDIRAGLLRENGNVDDHGFRGPIDLFCSK